MPFDQISKLLIILGVVIAVVGVLLLLLGRTPFRGLPGDINFSSGNFTCFVPVVSMIVISLLLTLILNIVLRIFR